jgi:hypothetical protein
MKSIRDIADIRRIKIARKNNTKKNQVNLKDEDGRRKFLLIQVHIEE